MSQCFLALVAVVTAAAAISVCAQERFSFFQASTAESVERMLALAELRDNDVVVDLGSGDGLIPLTAARMNPRLRGFGVDIDAKLVHSSNQRAKSEGVADRVRFEHRNAFDADLREATVITMWLFPELMRLLRPVILERARPGTRVLTSTWDLGTWKPDKVDSDQPPIYMWIVPARAAGGWEWELDIAGRRFEYSVVLEQHFQEVEGVARAGDRREVLESATLRGGEITFSLKITLDGVGPTDHTFSGNVDGDQISGTARVVPPGQDAMTLPLRGRRSTKPRYFAPTGTTIFQPIDQRW
jgi:hypothetical protein